MAYEVKISEFEGPLDLLIHLIKKSNIDIYDIKIEEVTKQYLAYIKQMEKINLNIASEYLIMATELIEIKSNSLLPIKEIIADDEEDLRNNLISRLLEYKNYKETVSSFKKLEALRKCFFTKPPSDLETCGLDIKPLLNDELVVNDLLFAFNNVMKHKKFIEPIST
ncbi:MAG: segregation/condensation protein A, partial [Bacilli bacterium]